MLKMWDNRNMNEANSFNINDTVVHCREGLSTILGTTQIGEKDYFLISTNNGASEKIYVPFDTCSKIIRHLMTIKEADELLVYMKSIKKEFNTNTKQRRDAFKKSLSIGDIKEIAYLSRLLYFYEELGPDNDEIRLGQVDLDMLNHADVMLMDELALTYKVEREKIKQFIAKKMMKIK